MGVGFEGSERSECKGQYRAHHQTSQQEEGHDSTCRTAGGGGGGVRLTNTKHQGADLPVQDGRDLSLSVRIES